MEILLSSVRTFFVELFLKVTSLVKWQKKCHHCARHAFSSENQLEKVHNHFPWNAVKCKFCNDVVSCVCVWGGGELFNTLYSPPPHTHTIVSNFKIFFNHGESMIYFWESNLEIFFIHGEWITLRDSRIKPIEWLCESRISIFSSIMVKKWLSEVVKLSQSGAFLRLEFPSVNLQSFHPVDKIGKIRSAPSRKSYHQVCSA